MTGLGILEYSKEAKIVAPLQDNMEALLPMLDKITFQRGVTDMAQGFSLAKTILMEGRKSPRACPAELGLFKKHCPRSSTLAFVHDLVSNDEVLHSVWRRFVNTAVKRRKRLAHLVFIFGPAPGRPRRW